MALVGDASASGRIGDFSKDTADPEVLPRLAHWLAMVSAEAALAPLRQPEPAADQANPGSSPE
jgi:hypothetical protein